MGATKRKATEEDVRKMSRGLMVNHGIVAGSVSLQDAARGLSSGGHDMESLSAALGDVELLAPEQSEDEAEQEADAEGEEEEEEVIDKNSRGSKKTKWWDRDRSVNKVHKQMRTIYDKMLGAAKAELQKTEELVADVRGMSSRSKKQLEGDLTILQSRTTCLQKVLERSDSLKQYLATFDGVPLSDKASSKSDPVKVLGKAAPSRTFRQLRAFSDWDIEVEQLLEAQSSEELETSKTAVNEIFKAPIADLCKCRCLQRNSKPSNLRPLTAGRRLVPSARLDFCRAFGGLDPMGGSPYWGDVCITVSATRS